jgi:hypothetical protein
MHKVGKGCRVWSSLFLGSFINFPLLMAIQHLVYIIPFLIMVAKKGLLHQVVGKSTWHK